MPTRLENQSSWKAKRAKGKPPTSGEYRLLVGLNAPEVLGGAATCTEGAVLRQPIEGLLGQRQPLLVGLLVVSADHAGVLPQLDERGEHRLLVHLVGEIDVQGTAVDNHLACIGRVHT